MFACFSSLCLKDVRASFHFYCVLRLPRKQLVVRPHISYATVFPHVDALPFRGGVSGDAGGVASGLHGGRMKKLMGKGLRTPACTRFPQHQRRPRRPVVR